MGIEHDTLGGNGSVDHLAARIIEGVVWWLHEGCSWVDSKGAQSLVYSRSELGAGVAEAAGILTCLHRYGCKDSPSIKSALLSSAVEVVPGLVRLAVLGGGGSGSMHALLALWRLGHMDVHVCAAIIASLGSREVQYFLNPNIYPANLSKL